MLNDNSQWVSYCVWQMQWHTYNKQYHYSHNISTGKRTMDAAFKMNIYTKSATTRQTYEILMNIPCEFHGLKP